ncbi:hypothetical protein [uncultured Duncaniella sp.]|uniref:hypothetical protein n=1 Tax=uncultured Duncaniella sp. TaxID=2768039 RepID=UPI002675A098|nr:hypothetical protein [uncultured Duncaniella sp.]
MAKKDSSNQGILCENPDMELIRRKIDRLENSLLDKITEINDTLGSIPKQPMFPTTAPEPHPAEPLEIHLPDDLAKSEDINRLFGMVQTFNSTLSLTLQGLGEIKKGFDALAKLNMQEVADKAATGAAQKVSHEIISTLSPKIENSAKDALNHGALKSPGISLDDASAINSRLGRMEKSLEIRDRNEWHKKRFRKLMTLHAVIVGLLCVAIWWAFDLKEQRDELLKIEWLYRLERVISPNADFTNRIEKEIINGSDEAREEWQSIIVEKEKAGTEFLYFQPHDDWQPEPQNEQPHSLKEVATGKKVKETDPAKMDSYELLEENMRRAKNGEHIIDPKTRK